ncbi:MAG: tetratricopeptide repeat protein [Leptolyngbya sp.]|nr:tetratricopeptide repeat protein [Candidatus Melainabacteria bacterium]
MKQSADWCNTGRSDAAKILSVAAKKLMVLSGCERKGFWKDYFALRAHFAQERGQHKAALRHARKAYSLSRDLYNDYRLGIAECNLGESLAMVGRKSDGVRLLEQGLARVKAQDFGKNEEKVAWQKATIQKLSATIATFI